MMRPLFVLGALALSQPALAVGVGSSAGIGTGGLFGGFGFGLGSGFVPSLDLHFAPAHVQIHVLETLSLLDDDTIYLGANAYFDVHEAPVSGDWNAVVQPGAGLDIVADPSVLILTAECRLGIEAFSGAGFGVYVVPALGIASGDDVEDGLVAGGAIQFSAWFGQ